MYAYYFDIYKTKNKIDHIIIKDFRNITWMIEQDIKEKIYKNETIISVLTKKVKYI